MSQTPNRPIAFFAVVAFFSAGVQAQDNAAAEIRQRIAEKVQAHQQGPGPIAEILAASGLSAEDAELTEGRLVDGVVACMLTAAESHAERHSIPVEDVLRSIELSVDDPHGGNSATIDMDEIERVAESCMFRALQEAGISYELILQHALSAAGASPGD